MVVLQPRGYTWLWRYEPVKLVEPLAGLGYKPLRGGVIPLFSWYPAGIWRPHPAPKGTRAGIPGCGDMAVIIRPN